MLVSVCIPTYEDEKKLKRAIESVQSQHNVDYEIIVSDDSKSSKIEDFLDKSHYDRVFFYKNTRKISSTSNWNNALSLARGEILILLHHDDYFSDEFTLARIINEFQFSKTNIVWSGFKSELSDEAVFSGKFCFKLLTRFPEQLFLINFLSTPSCMAIRNSVKLRYNEDLKWFVDVDFYYRCLKSYRNHVYLRDAQIFIGNDGNRISDRISRREKLREIELLPQKVRRKLHNPVLNFVLKIAVVAIQTTCYTLRLKGREQ